MLRLSVWWRRPGSSKAPISKLADRVSGVFVPIVISIAVLAIIVWLLVGEPFSFALSIGISGTGHFLSLRLGPRPPTAIMVGTGKGAENGILLNPQRHWRWPIPSARWYWTKPALSRRASPMSPILWMWPGPQSAAACRLSGEKFEHPLAAAIVAEAQSRTSPCCR